MFAQLLVKPTYGMAKVAVTYRSGTHSEKGDHGVRPGEVAARDSYVAGPGTAHTPIILNTAYSKQNVHRTYQNVMDAVTTTEWSDVELQESELVMPDSMLSRLTALSVLYKSAEMNGNLQAMRAAYDEAAVIRKLRAVPVKETR
jgi:hypothetical protein